MTTIQEGLILHQKKIQIISKNLFKGKRLENILNSRTLKELKSRLTSELKRIETKTESS